MIRFRRTGAGLILLSLVTAWSAVEGAGASQVLPDVRGAFGVLSAGAKVTNPQALQAELTLESGVKLWFSIGAIPSQRVAPSNGSSLAHYLSTYYLLAPNASVSFVGTFPEPGDRVTLTATLNSAEAALLNIEQVLVTAALAMVPGSKSVKPKVLVETLQDFKRVRGVYQASQAFLPPPKTAAGWVTASVKAADSLRGVLTDATQRALLLKALQKVGVEIAADDLKRLFAVDNVRGLLKIIADEAVFVYVTKGKEPAVIFERSGLSALGEPHGYRPVKRVSISGSVDASWSASAFEGVAMTHGRPTLPARACFRKESSSSWNTCFDAKLQGRARDVFQYVERLEVIPYLQTARGVDQAVLFVAALRQDAGDDGWLITLWSLTTGGSGPRNLMPTKEIPTQGEYRVFAITAGGHRGVVATAAYVWGDGETHYSHHRYRIRVYQLTGHSYALRHCYVTRRKYAGFDDAKTIDVIRHELSEIERRLSSGSESPRCPD